MEFVNFLSASPISLAIALTTVFLTIGYYTMKWRGLPPGPVGLPFIGIWPFLDDSTCGLQLDAYKKKYGEVFSFTVSGRLYISLGNAKVIREAHITNSDCFEGRISDFSLLSYVFEDGVGFTNGESWKVLRKYFLPVLKERGITSINDNVSEFMYDNIQNTLDFLKSKGGEPINIAELLTNPCKTILRQTLFGDTGTTDEKINAINEYYTTLTANMSAVNVLLSGKVAKYMILPFISSYRKVRKNLKGVGDVLYQMIDEHKATYDEEHIRDIIDEFLKERNERRNNGDPTAHYFTDKALMASLLLFIGDGVLSVVAFIILCLKAVVDRPDEQEKIYRELLEVVGMDRLPTLADKSRLTYTNAFILEVLRASDFFPFFPSLECSKETTIRGYKIPKGAMTLINTWCAHHDSNTYEEPEKFDPSRFISTEGKRRPEPPVTFGMGKRSCMGEGFALIQAFLFLTAIIQNFRLTLDEGKAANTFNLVLSGQIMVQAFPRTTP